MAQRNVFLVFVRKYNPHSVGGDCEPTITVHATLRGTKNAAKTFLEADRKTKYLRKIESDDEMDERWGRLFNREAIFMDRTRIRVFVKGRKVDFEGYTEDDAQSQNLDLLERDSTVEPDSEDCEEIDPNLDFPLAGWNPEDPIFRTRSTSLSGMNFACIGQLIPLERDGIRTLVNRNGGNWVPIQNSDIELVLQGHRVTEEQWKPANSQEQPVECAIGFFKHIQDIFHEHVEHLSKQTTTPAQGMPKALSRLIFAVTDCPGAKEIIALIDEHGGTQIPLQDMSNIAYVVGDRNESPEVIEVLHKHKPTLTDLRGLLTLAMNMSGERRGATPLAQIERELPPRSLKRPLEQTSEGQPPENRSGPASEKSHIRPIKTVPLAHH